MTTTRSTAITSFDLFKLAIGLAVLGWAALDWPSYSAAVSATLGAAIVWLLASTAELAPRLLGLDSLT